MIYTVGEFLRVIDLAGVFANALLGGIVAREQRMDPVGFVVLAIVSGLGGGLISALAYVLVRNVFPAVLWPRLPVLSR